VGVRLRRAVTRVARRPFILGSARGRQGASPR
jgi:hypothetical protein